MQVSGTVVLLKTEFFNNQAFCGFNDVVSTGTAVLLKTATSSVKGGSIKNSCSGLTLCTTLGYKSCNASGTGCECAASDIEKTDETGCIPRPSPPNPPSPIEPCTATDGSVANSEDCACGTQ